MPKWKKSSNYIEQEKPQSCAVIGGGFIGIELAENFIHKGLKTALIDRNDRIMNVMDPEISEVLGQEMKDNQVEFTSKMPLNALKASVYNEKWFEF